MILPCQVSGSRNTEHWALGIKPGNILVKIFIVTQSETNDLAGLTGIARKILFRSFVKKINLIYIFVSCLQNLNEKLEFISI